MKKISFCKFENVSFLCHKFIRFKNHNFRHQRKIVFSSKQQRFSDFNLKFRYHCTKKGVLRCATTSRTVFKVSGPTSRMNFVSSFRQGWLFKSRLPYRHLYYFINIYRLQYLIICLLSNVINIKFFLVRINDVLRFHFNRLREVQISLKCLLIMFQIKVCF